MAAKLRLSRIRFAIYDAMLGGDSAREVAVRYDVSHPTAVKYAEEAISELRTMTLVRTDPHLESFLAGNLRMQCYAVESGILERIRRIISPLVQQADDLATAPKEKQTLTLSARLPESLFYRFKRLASEVARERNEAVTISSLVNELVLHYVESGVPLMTETKFRQVDLVMDDIRGVLARHGLASD